jgi:hypothetical protein
LIVLLLVAPLIIPIVSEIANPIVGGLNNSFVDMSTATISQVIEVNDTMGIAFDLPLAETTEVKIVQEVPLDGVPAQFVLPNGGGSINGQVFLALPEGLTMPVYLEMTVPVSQTIPVELAVDVNIPLSETELGGPFNQLRSLFAPLDALLRGLPATNQDLINRVLGQTSAPAAVDPVAAEVETAP